MRPHHHHQQQQNNNNHWQQQQQHQDQQSNHHHHHHQSNDDADNQNDDDLIIHHHNRYSYRPSGGDSDSDHRHHHHHHHRGGGSVNAAMAAGGGGGGLYGGAAADVADLKAQVVSHPLFKQLLAAHVTCLQVAARPFSSSNSNSNNRATANNGQLPPPLAASNYLANNGQLPPLLAASNYLHQSSSSSASTNFDKEELNQFMVSYILLLESFKQQLEEHLSTQTAEALTACLEIERSLYHLTGVCVGPGNGSLMPEEEDDKHHTNAEMNNVYNFGQDNVYTYALDAFSAHDIDRALIDNVRQELKKELKEDYRSKLRDVRDEIMRKRRAGKLPGETTHVLKDWWNTHAKWPYPTEEDKIRLAEESGLELKQINNWFINQRKRNWQAEQNNSMNCDDDQSAALDNPVDVSLSLMNNPEHEVHGSNPSS